MNDQTFHTPSFGDEEFDIPSMHGHSNANAGVQNSHIQFAQLHHPPQVGMMNPAQDGLSPPGGTPSFQQPLYLQEPHTSVTSQSGAGAPAGNYMIQQQPGGQQRLLIMQPTQTLSSPIQSSGQVYESPQRASPPGTTSDDSDDSVPSLHSQLPGDAESLLPIHYCSASRQQQSALHQVGVSNMGMKRSSPELMDNTVNRGQLQKKPKVQKKKKKRDPNEPQKPVSAYALFFRDTQAAIKGQNPNASFGEVSKIVASMWDGLDSEHKSVYKQKTEVAKKEYLKALAAYRASLVSKGGEQEATVMFNPSNTTSPTYGNYYHSQSYGSGHPPQGYAPSPSQRYSPQSYVNGQPQNTYPVQTSQGYPSSSQQSPQNYTGNINRSPQTYQAISGQSPQNYQAANVVSSPSCQPSISQSPRSYPSVQSPPNYPANSGLSPSNFATSPQGINSVHSAMQFHSQQAHQQMQQVHQYHHHQEQQMQNATIKSDPLQATTNGTPHNTVPQKSPENSESRSMASCIRRGCTNPAIANSEWEDEYCSNECVVSHCRDVFSSWVASNNNSQIQTYSAVK